MQNNCRYFGSPCNLHSIIIIRTDSVLQKYSGALFCTQKQNDLCKWRMGEGRRRSRDGGRWVGGVSTDEIEDKGVKDDGDRFVMDLVQLNISPLFCATA